MILINEQALHIITMNRPYDLNSTLHSIFRCKYVPKKILILDNNSSLNNKKKYKNIFLKRKNIKWYFSENNLGVAGGRSFLLKKSSSSEIIEIDDDVNIEDELFFFKIHNTFLTKSNSVGILAFNVINFHTRKHVRKEFPFYFKGNYSKSSYSEVAWFIGAGHAFRLDLINKIGQYRDFFPYGSEEQDFSIRAIDAGFKIIFCNNLKIYHKQSPTARKILNKELAILLFTNRLKFVLLNLPLFLFPIHFVLRGGQTVIKNRNLIIPFKSLLNIFKQIGYIRSCRKPISLKSIIYLIKIKGQVFF